MGSILVLYDLDVIRVGRKENGKVDLRDVLKEDI